ncbi:hypothetical protein [Synechococcus phage Ssp-JY39]|nr:N-acetylmuramoyl-L-alanine amidase [Synechococcus phage Yong-M2-251]
MTTLLKRGSRGAAVRDLQTMLIKAGYPLPRFGADGDFGDETEDAVRAFQRKFELVPDGKVGPQSRTALKQATTPVLPGRAEPNKSAINRAVERLNVAGNDNIVPPSNVASFKLLDTARTIDTLWVHCAATPEGKDFTVADIRAWHKARGWSDIGYHYIVYRDGRVMLGRPVGQVGAHVSGHNTGSIGIVYVGGLSADGKTAKDTRTAAQRSSLLWLTRELTKKHGIRRVRGHNEVAAKACPSFIVKDDPLGRIAA